MFESDAASEFQHQHADSAQIHEQALVESPTVVGERSTILPFARVMGHVRIGDDCLVGHHVTMAPGVILGQNSRVLDHSLITSGAILGDDVYCGPFTVFSNPRRVRVDGPNVSRISPTVLRERSSIGAHVVIASGVTIGRAAFIEPHCVIDRAIPDYAIMSGNPLKLKGWRCECGQPLQFKQLLETECEACGTRYHFVAEFKVEKIKKAHELNVDKAV